MTKKQKLKTLLIILLFLIVIASLLLKTKKNSYELKYNDYKVNVIENKETNKYNIKFEVSKVTYDLDLYRSTKQDRIVTKVYYFDKDNYKCILPIIDNKLEVDMMCYKGNTLYDYNAIKGENNKLDEFVSGIKEYDSNKFSDDKTKYHKFGVTKYYENNKTNNIVSITTYKGLLVDDEEITLFDSDVYNNKISTYIDKYYLIADYNKSYDFNYFYVVNLKTKEVFKIKSKEEISFDSYIQGIVDNKVYLYDVDNENQYEIDIDNKQVKLISTNDDVKYYNHNKWEKLNKKRANKEILFNYSSLDNNFTAYNVVIETNDYFYLLNKNESNYLLYRVDKDNIKVIKYIGKVPTSNISYKDGYLYYSYKDEVYYYSDNTGLKTLLENSELEFNSTIKYYIY